MTIQNNQSHIKTSKNTFIAHSWNMITRFQRIPYFGKILGIPFAQLASAKEEADFGEALADSLFLLFSTLDEVGTVDLINTLLDGVYSVKTNQQVNIETDFDGDMSEVIELCVSAFKFQYGSLLKGKSLQGLMEVGSGISALKG